MISIKIDDNVEAELYVIRHVDGKRIRIPVQVNENGNLRKTKIPNGVIMVKCYGSGDKKHYKGLWNKKYEFKKRNYLEMASSIDKLLPKLEKYNCPVFNYENAKRLL